MVQGGLVSLMLFSLYVKDMHILSRYVELAQYTNDSSRSQVMQPIASRWLSEDIPA